MDKVFKIKVYQKGHHPFECSFDNEKDFDSYVLSTIKNMKDGYVKKFEVNYL